MTAHRCNGASVPLNFSWLSRGWLYMTLRTSESRTATATLTMPVSKVAAAVAAGLPWACSLNQRPCSARPLLVALASLSAPHTQY